MKLRDFMSIFENGWVVVMDDDTNETLFATYWANDWPAEYLVSFAEKEVVQINAYPASEKERAVLDVDCTVECGDTIFYLRVV